MSLISLNAKLLMSDTTLLFVLLITTIEELWLKNEASTFYLISWDIYSEIHYYSFFNQRQLNHMSVLHNDVLKSL